MIQPEADKLIAERGTGSVPSADLTRGARKTIWLTGGSGFLGSHILPLLTRDRWRIAYIRGRHRVAGEAIWALHATLTEPDGLHGAARGFPPDVIIHAAAISTAKACLENPEQARQINVEATRHLANLARENGAHFIYISTDMVFDGKAAPYAEDASPAPISLYGETKAEGERAVMESGASWAVLRCPLMYGLIKGEHQNSNLSWLLKGLRGDDPLPKLFDDEWRSVGDVRYVAQAIVQAAETKASGVFHLGGPERLSRWDFGQLVADVWGLPQEKIERGSINDFQGAEPRPADLALISDRARAELHYQHPSVVDSLRELHELESSKKPANASVW
jgi:dTDP-4-dehydrorhamnose reductase